MVGDVVWHTGAADAFQFPWKHMPGGPTFQKYSTTSCSFQCLTPVWKNTTEQDSNQIPAKICQICMCVCVFIMSPNIFHGDKWVGCSSHSVMGNRSMDSLRVFVCVLVLLVLWGHPFYYTVTQLKGKAAPFMVNHDISQLGLSLFWRLFTGNELVKVEVGLYTSM